MGVDMAKKPEHLKVVCGTVRKDRVSIPDIEIAPIVEIPKCPDWMPNAHAIKEWDRIVPILIANKLLTEADLGTLAQMCALHGKIVQLYAAGESPGASMIGTLRTLQNDFGLSPVARGKVHATSGTDKKENAFTGNGKKV
jgi:phage terminase small subunit